MEKSKSGHSILEIEASSQWVAATMGSIGVADEMTILV